MSYKVSVLIPVYNIEKYVSKCMDSIINQTYQNLEIIAVNDGSTDDSGRILDEYAIKDSRVRVIHQKNGGLIIVRRNAVLACTSDILMFIDGDDWLDFDTIELLVKRQIETDADITIGQYQRVDDNGCVTINYSTERNALTLNQNTYIKYLSQFRISHSLGMRLYKRTLFKDDFMLFDRGLEMGEDLVSNMQMLEDVNIVALEPKATYNWYIRSDSICSTTTPDVEYYIRLYQAGYKLMGEEILAKYKTYFDTELIKIGCKLIYNSLVKDKESYIGTNAYEHIKVLIKQNKKTIRKRGFPLMKKMRIKLIAGRPFWLQFVVKLHIFIKEGRWCSLTPIGDNL